MPIQAVKGNRCLAIRGMNRRQTFGRGTFESPILQGAFKISGITKDFLGNPLGSCVVDLYRTYDDVMVQEQISDPVTGAYAFYTAGGGSYYIVAYKAGAPDVSGTTVNTLLATPV